MFEILPDAARRRVKSTRKGNYAVVGGKLPGRWSAIQRRWSAIQRRWRGIQRRRRGIPARWSARQGRWRQIPARRGPLQERWDARQGCWGRFGEVGAGCNGLGALYGDVGVLCTEVKRLCGPLFSQSCRRFYHEDHEAREEGSGRRSLDGAAKSQTLSSFVSFVVKRTGYDADSVSGLPDGKVVASSLQAHQTLVKIDEITSRKAEMVSMALFGSPLI